MNPLDLAQRARQIASDRDAGASEILAAVLPVLDETVKAGPDLARPVVSAILESQPGMASLWNACAAVAADLQTSGIFDRTRAEMARAPAALRRTSAIALADLCLGVRQPRFLTLSYSSAVRQALSDLAQVRSIEVVCAESRPRLEGRRLARKLADAGARVTLVTDAAIATALENATGVIVGADAVTPRDWINKVGTRGLAAAATTTGTPVVVLTAQDKFVPPALEARLQLVGGPAGEVWADAPPELGLLNPVFEATPLTLASLMVTDRGTMAPSAVRDAAGRWQPAALALLNLIG